MYYMNSTPNYPKRFLSTRFSLIACLSVLILGFSLNARAAYPDFYIGGGLGWANMDKGSGDFLPFSSGTQEDGMAGQVKLGYQFSQNFAMESNYTFYGKNFFENVYQDTWDVVAKGLLPMSTEYSLFADAGIAYVNQKITDSDTVRPEYGIGVRTKLSPHASADFSLSRIVGHDELRDSNQALVDILWYF